ncbi:MAG: NosD domain-containing protein [Candidatus Heimdallarchaeaceae archaeon]
MRKTNGLIVLTILFLLFSSSSIYSSIQGDLGHSKQSHINSSFFNEKVFNSNMLISHPPIEILSDQDFIDYGFAGSGTEEEPYRIENYNITTLAYFGIRIENTTKYFIIQNCFIDAYYTGISVDGVAPFTVKVINNICANHNLYGIFLQRTDFMTVSGNECYNNKIGLAFQFADKIEISDNYCHNNSQSGIYIIFSNFITISNNTIYQSRYGIHCPHTQESIIESNTVTNSSNAGLYIDSCRDIIIRENNCTDGYLGIFTAHSTLLTIQENNCDYNYANGIYLSDTNSSNIISNSCDYNKWSGIRIQVREDILIENNNSTNNLGSGIRTHHIDIWIYNPPIIRNNLCVENLYGIGIYSTDSATISYNILLRNSEYGVFLDDDSNRNKIHHNDFIDNNENGTEYGESQGYDDGFGNEWYDTDSDEGNHWSNHRGSDEYLIDGKAGSSDPYPFGEPLVYTPTDGANFNIIFIPITLLLITRFIYRTNSRKTKSRYHLQ